MNTEIHIPQEHTEAVLSCAASTERSTRNSMRRYASTWSHTA